MTAADLGAYRAIERRPTQRRVPRLRRLRAWPRRRSGGTTVGEALNILEQLRRLGGDRRRRAAPLPRGLAPRVRRPRRVPRRPGVLDGPRSHACSPTPFAASRRALIGATAARRTPRCRRAYHGTPPGAGHRGDQPARGQSTTHLTVADASGKVVTYTFTIESIGGNGIVVPGLGLPAQQRAHGLHLHRHGRAEPRRAAASDRARRWRPPTSSARDSRSWRSARRAARRIITTVLQVLTERLDFGRTLPQAIAAPRASQRNGPTTEPEQGFIDAYGAALTGSPFGEAFGTPNPELGAVTAIEFRRRGRMLAAAEPVRRGGGNAQVVKVSGGTRARR